MDMPGGDVCVEQDMVVMIHTCCHRHLSVIITSHKLFLFFRTRVQVQPEPNSHLLLRLKAAV